jgi:Uma2 family endonuclease
MKCAVYEEWPERMSVEEYLAFEEKSEGRHEYFAGYIVAMAGASRQHEEISLTLAAALHAHLRGTPCRPYKGDVKLKTTFRGEDIFYYPDIMVACDPADDHPVYVERPKLIIEVSSKDWERDYVAKFAAYTRIASLEEYAIVWSEKKRPLVSVFRRRVGWEPAAEHRAGTFTLESVGLTLEVESLYS